MAEKFVKNLLESIQNPDRQKDFLKILQEAQKGEVRIDDKNAKEVGMAYVLQEAGFLNYRGSAFKDDTYATCSVFVITDEGKVVGNEWANQK